jgi:hypothetical protein
MEPLDQVLEQEQEQEQSDMGKFVSVRSEREREREREREMRGGWCIPCLFQEGQQTKAHDQPSSWSESNRPQFQLPATYDIVAKVV